MDILKKLIVACATLPDSNGLAHKQVRSFGAMSDDLQLLSDWLMEHSVTHVAMESTGSYWKPVVNVLEERFELLLVNAQHLKAVSGRKTDVNDAEWMASDNHWNGNVRQGCRGRARPQSRQSSTGG